MTDVYIVDGVRTPFLKASSSKGKFTASDLAVCAVEHLLLRQKLTPNVISEVITGCVMPSCEEANISRIIALRIGCGHAVPAWTVQRNCASGLQAIDAAVTNIATGKSNLVLAGGSEAMSLAPVLLQPKLLLYVQNILAAKKFQAKLCALLKFKLALLKPIFGLLKGLVDPNVGINMGATAEKLSAKFNISRSDMDEYTVSSHKKAVNISSEYQDTIVSIYDDSGVVHDCDDGIRADSNVAKLKTLKPVFVKKYGTVTAANSSQISDGAAFLLLANSQALQQHNLKSNIKVLDIAWVGLDPSIMGLGPAYAIRKILQDNKLTIADIAFWEINEAFAGQVLACVAELKTLDIDKLNIAGGAIAIGHPLGATGARITLQLAKILQKNNARYGIASLCIGGGQGGAILLENINAEGAK